MSEIILPSVFDVADFIIADYHRRLRDPLDDDLMTHMKLQKLLYFSQGFSLHFHDEPLFNEPLEAWPHGPVCPALYERYKRFNDEPIKSDLALEDVKIRFTSNQLNTMITVMSLYGSYTAAKLRKLSHADFAWQEAIKKSNHTMSLDNIKLSFDKRLQIGEPSVVQTTKEDNERILKLTEELGIKDSLDILYE